MAAKTKSAEPFQDNRAVGMFQSEGEDTATANDITQCTNKHFGVFLRVHSGEYEKSKR